MNQEGTVSAAKSYKGIDGRWHCPGGNLTVETVPGGTRTQREEDLGRTRTRRVGGRKKWREGGRNGGGGGGEGVLRE